MRRESFFLWGVMPVREEKERTDSKSFEHLSTSLHLSSFSSHLHRHPQQRHPAPAPAPSPHGISDGHEGLFGKRKSLTVVARWMSASGLRRYGGQGEAGGWMHM
jgi:hypothetical protein